MKADVSAPLIEDAIKNYCDSVGAWQRFIGLTLSGPHGKDLAVMQRQLFVDGQRAYKLGELSRAAKSLGSGLSLPTYGVVEERSEILQDFCEAWLETRPTQPRVDVALLMIEAHGRNVPVAIERRHRVIEVLRECIVIEPGGSWLIIATAEAKGIKETELRW